VGDLEFRPVADIYASGIADLGIAQQSTVMAMRRRSVLGSLGALLGLWGSKAATAVPADEIVMAEGDRFRPAPLATSWTVPPLPDGWHLVTYSILSGGQLAIVGSDADLTHEWRRDAEGRVLGKPSEVAAQASGQIWTFDGAELKAGPAFPLQTPFPLVDRFSNGRWLIATSRKWEGTSDRILAEDGRELAVLQLGDGIMHLKIDGSDRIWVGWFDEGVFGNEGWRAPDLEWPPSAYGLAAFSDEGRVLRVSEGAAPEDRIADCYALNVVGDAAWACTYPGSPISLSEAGSTFRWWRTNLPASVALAISAPYFLAAGGYGDNGDKVILGRLDTEQTTVIGEWRLPFRVGFSTSADIVDAREDRLHVVVDGVWHVWRIDQFQA
jgi:hypothetical protein